MEKMALHYTDFEENPIIFRGSLKNKSYFTGTEYTYEINELIFKYTKWSYFTKNGKTENQWMKKRTFSIKTRNENIKLSRNKTKKKLKYLRADYLNFLKKYDIEKENLIKRIIHLIENEYYSRKIKSFLKKKNTTYPEIKLLTQFRVLMENLR